VLLGGIALLSLGILTAPGQGIEPLRFLTAAVCALQADRQIALGGMTLPLCFRCTGIYLGVASSLSYLVIVRRGHWGWPRPFALLLLVGFILAVIVDGLNSLLADLHEPTLYAPQNSLRLATGLFAGIALGVSVSGLTRLFVGASASPAGPLRARDIAAMLAFATAGSGGIVVQAGSLAYPIGLVSALGVVAALTCINRWMIELSPAAALRWLPSPDLCWMLAVLLALTELATLATLRMVVAPIP
jgi:uncharacterized membrane protein